MRLGIGVEEGVGNRDLGDFGEASQIRCSEMRLWGRRGVWNRGWGCRGCGSMTSSLKSVLLQ